MLKLRDQQHALTHWIVNEVTDEPAGIVASGQLSASQSAGVYRDSIREIHIGAMMLMFPVVEKLIGEEAFRATCRRFLQTSSSDHHSLTWLGEPFPQFLREFQPLQSLPYLSDVAQLEWLYQLSYDGADDQPDDWSSFEQYAAEQPLAFRLPDNAHLLHSAYPVKDIWLLNQPNAPADLQVNLNDGPQALLVWRQHMDMRMDVLDDDTHAFLQAVQQHPEFNDACEQFAALRPEADIASLLPTCIQQGWISHYRPLA